MSGFIYLLLIFFKHGEFCLLECYCNSPDGVIVWTTLQLFPLVKVGHLHCAVKVQSTRPFYNCSHLQCRKHGIVDSLLEIVHNWVALFINSFLTTSVEDQAGSDRKLINFIREGYRAPYTPQALVSGGSNNVGIVKGGGDHSSSHQAGYVRHV